jgi:hypothetical protein
LIKLSKASWKNILITTITILIILIVLLSKAYIREDTLQRQVNNAFGESLSLALGGLNIDYSKIDETSKVYHYSEVIAGLGAAEGLIDFTSYKDVRELSYTLQNLKLFLIQNYYSGFSFGLEEQIDIYNLLLEIMLNPTDEDAITRLEKYIDSIK